VTDDECREAYEWLLRELERANAVDLLIEIDASVRRGIVREEEQGEGGKVVATRVPLSGHERLVEALQLVLSAASVPLMMRSVSALVDNPAPLLLWTPDFIEDSPVRLIGEDATVQIVTYKLPESERLLALDAAARETLRLLNELAREAS
jgi:hypothetical protein